MLVTATTELFSPEYISRAPADLAVRRHIKEIGEAGTLAPDKGDVKEAIEPNLDAIFSDVHLSVLEAIEQGDKVVVRRRLRGKWTGPLPFATKDQADWQTRRFHRNQHLPLRREPDR